MKASVLQPLAIAVLLGVMVSSCQKEDNDPSTPVCRVTSTIFADTMELKLEYDQQGRLVKETDVWSGVDHLYIHWSYSNGQIKEWDGTPDVPSPFYTAIYTLGANGYAATRTEGADNSYKDTVYYTYDGNGYLVKSVQRHYQYNNTTSAYWLSYTDVHDYVIVNGNRVSDKPYMIMGNAVSYYTADAAYEYYSGQQHYGSINFNVQDNYPFLGKSNVSLLKKGTFTYHSGDVDTAEYTYQFDSDGKPVRSDYIFTTKYRPWPEHVVFGYNCQ